MGWIAGDLPTRTATIKDRRGIASSRIGFVSGWCCSTSAGIQHRTGVQSRFLARAGQKLVESLVSQSAGPRHKSSPWPSQLPPGVEVAAEVCSILADISHIASNVCSISGDLSGSTESQVAIKHPKVLSKVDPVAKQIAAIGTNVSGGKPAREATEETRSAEEARPSEPAWKAGGKVRPVEAAPRSASRAPGIRVW